MLKNFLLLIILLFFVFSNANAYFCDWYTSGVSCSTWSIYESIDWLTNFSSTYNDINLGYFWTNFSKDLSENLDWTLGYFWNKFSHKLWEEIWSTIGFIWTNRNVHSPHYQFPVWTFSNYKNQTLVFYEQPEENNFLSYPMIRYISEVSVVLESESILSWVSSNVNACGIPNNVTWVKSEIKSDWLLDYINISWINSTWEKIKIIKISPEYKEFFVEDWKSNFEDSSLISGSNYSYFIVVYNDCYKNWFYSDALTIKYTWKNDNWKIYLSLLNNELSLNIPSNLELNSKASLSCKDTVKTIINDYLIDNKYLLEWDLSKKYFSCEASFYDKKGDYYKSEVYVNKPSLYDFMTEKEALDFVYVWDSSELLFRDLYLNVSKVEDNAYLTYGKTSLYLSNILFKTYLSDENVSFDIFSEMWLFKSWVSKTDKINEKDFIDLVLFIEKDLFKYKNDFILLLDESYWDKKYNLALREIDKVFLINKYLKEYKSTDKKKFDSLNNCVSHVSCDDVSILKNIDNELYLTSKRTQANDIKTYNDYIKLLYYEAWYNSYIKKWYSEANYNKLIDIIKESLTYWNSFYNKSISFDSFQNLQYEVIFYDKLKSNISLLTEKYLDKIILIYDDYSSKKEELLGILKSFLES